MPEGDTPRPTRASRRSEATKEAAKVVPTAPELPRLHPRFREVQPLLARFLPEVPSSQLGLRSDFCDLYVFLSYLHTQGWSGYLHSFLEGGAAVWVLMLRGRAVAAAADYSATQATQSGETTAEDEQALGEMILSYAAGAQLAAYPLSAVYAELLSGLGSSGLGGGGLGLNGLRSGGLGSGAQQFTLSSDFSGVYARPAGAVLYLNGEAVATLDVSLPYEAAFPAPAAAPPLVLPRHLAGWAHATYQPTLRGRDVLSPITAAHSEFHAEFGQELPLALMTALVRGLSPAEFALEHDTSLAEIEPWLSRFREQGYLVR